MSQIYISAFVIILAQIANFFGVPYANDQLVTVATFFVTIILNGWIMFRRYQQRDINVAGAKV